MIKTRRINSVRGKVDFVVMTIRDDELTAIRRRFSPSIPVLDGRQHYDIHKLQKLDGTSVTVAVARAMEQGHSAALLAAQYAIEDLDPQWIIIAGIAGAVADSEFTLGDVMLANSVHDFSVGAAIEGKPMQLRMGGGSMHAAVERLLTGLPARRPDLGDWNGEAGIGRPVPEITIPDDLEDDVYYGPEEEREKLRLILNGHFSKQGKIRSPDFHVGAAATSNTLVKDTAILRQWRDAVRHITHIEMELGGAYFVARRNKPEMPLLSVRGISDVVGFKRGDEWTVFACDSAASFLHALLRIIPNEAFDIKPRAMASAIQQAASSLPRNVQWLVNVCLGAVMDLGSWAASILPGAPARGPSVDEIVHAFGKTSAPLIARVVDPAERIARAEIGEVESRFSTDTGRILCVLGGPGSGKTAFLAMVSQDAAKAGIATLALKADLLPKDHPFENWGQREIGIDFSAFDAVRVVASRRRVLVVVDQLDAISSIVAVSSDLFNLVVDFVRKCAELPNVSVVCSCRAFDFNHDARFAELNAETIELSVPKWEEVAKQLDRHGIQGSDKWPEEFRKILQTPQHLRVFLDRFAETGNSDFRGSYHLMLDDLWSRNVTSASERKFLDSLTEYLMANEELWAPLAAFASDTVTVNELKRKGLLEIQGLTVGFRHQTLLEHSKARYFTRTEQSFSRYVQAHENALQVRPTVWSVLEYLRSARPQKYKIEIESLFGLQLRLHLRYLLIEFLGQNKAPHDYEKALMGARLFDEEDRIRALISILGNPDWFDALYATHLPVVMRGDIKLQWPMVGVINGVWQRDHDACLSLVKNNWFTDPEKDALTIRVLSQTDRWGADELEMASALIRRSRDTGDRFFWAEQMVYNVSAIQPDMAPQLFVETICKLTESDNQRTPLEFNQSWYELPAVAEAAPIAFLRAGWNWFVSTCEKHHGGPVSSVIDHYEGYILSLDEDSRRPESLVLSAYITAIEGAVALDPAAFVEITKPSWASENAVVHRMIVRGLTVVAETLPEVGLEYLAGDRRRFQVGSYHSENRSDSVKLIAALSPRLNADERHQLESLIVGWTHYRDGQVLGAEQKKWDREERLHLLNAIPPALRSPKIAQLAESEKAELPGWDRERPRSRSGFVHEKSPLTKDQMAEASAQDIAHVICNTPQIPYAERERREVEGGWEVPGGPIAAGRQLAELNKVNPQKVAEVIVQLVARGQEDAASNAFEGLADSGLTQDQILELARALAQLSPKSKDLRHAIAYMLYRRAKKPQGIPDDICAVLSDWLAEYGSVEAEQPQATDSDEGQIADDGSSVLWGNAGQIGIRPIHYPFWLLLALTEGYLERTAPAFSEWLSEIERCLSTNFSERTWADYCGHLVNIRHAKGHETRGVAIVTELLGRFPNLRRRADLLSLIANVSDLLPPEQLQKLLAELRADSQPVVRQAYGELITLFAFRAEQPHLWARATLDAELTMGDAGELDERIAVGIAFAAAHLWDESWARSDSAKALGQLIPIANDRIGRAISTVFWSRQDFADDEYTEQLLSSLAANSESLQHIPVSDLVPHLVTLAPYKRELVLSLCEAILISRNEENRLFEVGPDLVTISMTLQRFNETRARALDLFEQLLRLGLDAAFHVLQEIDIRPAASYAPPQRPRRRRKRIRPKR